MSIARLRELLLKHEGLRLKPYKDTMGVTSIGCGRNLEDVGISKNEALLLLQNDIDRVIKQCTEKLAWFNSISMVRQDVVASMVFNMGLERFQGFKKMIAAVQSGNYTEAANQMKQSMWAGQVGRRAVDLADMMRDGVYPFSV